MKYQQNLLVGALLVVTAEFCMASMGAMVKLLGETMPNEMAVFARNLAGLLVLLPVLLTRHDFSLKTDCLHLHLLRSLAGLSAMYCFFYAIIHLPLADSMLLKMTAPLFMPVIAIIWLSEGISQWTVLALLLGFAGVWVILGPAGEANWAMLVGIAGGFLAAVAKVSIRRLSRTEPNLRVVTYFALVGTIVSAVPAVFSWKTPAINGIWLMVAIGLVGTLGQLALTRAYSISNAGKVAPLTYFSVIFGGIYGFVFWGEIPQQQFIIGAVMIAVAGLLTIQKPVRQKPLPDTL
mgnify:FL=1